MENQSYKVSMYVGSGKTEIKYADGINYDQVTTDATYQQESQNRNKKVRLGAAIGALVFGAYMAIALDKQAHVPSVATTGESTPTPALMAVNNNEFVPSPKSTSDALAEQMIESGCYHETTVRFQRCNEKADKSRLQATATAVAETTAVARETAEAVLIEEILENQCYLNDTPRVMRCADNLNKPALQATVTAVAEQTATAIGTQ